MKNSINEFMSRDHDRLDNIFNEFVNNRKKKSSQAKQLFSQFKQGLEKHIVWEEEILFPLFEKKTGSSEGPTQVMRIEHIEIKKNLADILNTLNKDRYNTEKIEKQLISILSDHNGKEEMILYPWIDNSINEKERKNALEEIENL